MTPIQKHNRLILLQMYITSALSKNDMKGMALQMALEILHKDAGTDVITGLKTRTQPGRPKWQQVSIVPCHITTGDT